MSVRGKLPCKHTRKEPDCDRSSLRKCCGWATHSRPCGERGLCRGGESQGPEEEKGPSCGGRALGAQARPPGVGWRGYPLP